MNEHGLNFRQIITDCQIGRLLSVRLELKQVARTLIDGFARDARPLLPGHEGPYLFPAGGGGPRSDGALRHAIKTGMKRGAGLVMSPHLFRHTIAKIIIELDPSMYAAMSRHLGHKSMNTLLASYVGAETRNASRHFNRLLAMARANPKIEE